MRSDRSKPSGGSSASLAAGALMNGAPPPIKVSSRWGETKSHRRQKRKEASTQERGRGAPSTLSALYILPSLFPFSLNPIFEAPQVSFTALAPSLPLHPTHQHSASLPHFYLLALLPLLPMRLQTKAGDAAATSKASELSASSEGLTSTLGRSTAPPTGAGAGGC